METPQPINIRVLTGFLDSLESYSQDLVQHLRSGAKLCHYTSLAGALGIIRSGDLWLTNLLYSNDDEELRHGQRLVDDLLDEMLLDPTAPTWLPLLRQRLADTRDQQVYICCFCEVDNLLSQWRGYADDGGGLSIEFDPEGFTGIAGPDCVHGLMRLWKVFYKLEQQKGIIRACIDYPHWPAPDDDTRVRFVADALQFFMPTFKNADFAEEKERRLIFTPNQGIQPKPQFRTRGGLLVPYFSLKDLASHGAGASTFQLPIRAVRIGPTRYRSLNVASTRMALEEHGHRNVSVEASPTPYRS